MLYIVATPIGNLKDITLRALEVLKDVDLIACEDTRHTKILLDAYDIKKPCLSYYEYNKFVRGEQILEKLKGGKSVALVTDAGTPGICDPGLALIQTALKNNIKVVPIPGPCAFICALSASGKSANKFIFDGFLPIKSGPRKKRIGELLKEERTIVLYESCHRILKLLEDMIQVCPEREVIVTREVTKKFEETLRGTPFELKGHLTKNKPRGEFIVIL